MSSFLATAVVFFPLWFSLWQQAPLSSEQLACTGRISVPQEQLQLLRQHYKDYSPEFRTLLARQLSAAPIPAVQQLFLEWLKNEKDPLVRAEIIRMLPALGLEKTDMADLLQEDSVPVQEEALRILAKQNRCSLAVIRRFLLAEKNPVPPALQKMAWRILAAGKAEQLPDLDCLQKIQSSEDEELRGLGLTAACRLRPRPSQVSQWLDRAVQESPVMRLAAAADPWPENRSRLLKLCEDEFPAVRIQLCKVLDQKHKDILLRMLHDGEPAVREAACRRLAGVHTLTDSEFMQTVNLLNDDSLAVRNAAEQTVSEQFRTQKQARLPLVHMLLDDLSNDENTLAALFRIAADLKLRGETGAAVAALRKTDAGPELLVSALHFLSMSASGNSASDQILVLAVHRSPLVRAAVAEACGWLKLQNAVPVLKKLVQPSQPAAVREAAFLAMGRNPQPEFAADILKCLEQVTRTTVQERSNAAWAAGFLPVDSRSAGSHRRMAGRMVVQCTTPVIPGMAPVFDSIEVVANAMISLAVMSRRMKGEYAADFEKVRRLYDVSAEQMTAKTADMDMVPRTELTRDLIGQMKNYLSGQKPVPLEVPGSVMDFALQKIEQKQECR